MDNLDDSSTNEAAIQQNFEIVSSGESGSDVTDEEFQFDDDVFSLYSSAESGSSDDDEFSLKFIAMSNDVLFYALIHDCDLSKLFCTFSRYKIAKFS